MKARVGLVLVAAVTGAAAAVPGLGLPARVFLLVVAAAEVLVAARRPLAGSVAAAVAGRPVVAARAAAVDQLERQERFRRLLAFYGAAANDYDAGEEEDPRPFLNGDEPLARFVCVTENYSSHGSAKPFFLPVFDSVEAAAARAVEFARDDCFEELPVEVVDLDSGDSWVPRWSTLQWRVVASPQPGRRSGS